jgi:hypothetical protein
MTMQTTKVHHARLLAGAALVLLVGGAVWLRQGSVKRTKPPAPISLVTTSVAISPRPMGEGASPTRRPLRPGTSSASVSKVQGAWKLLQAEPDAAAARQCLAELRAQLALMPKTAAVAELRQFLDTKADARTRLGFKLAGSGLLEEAPTLRTFLLDEMARLDPAAAAVYAHVILVTKDSAEEWAVALRNLAWGDKSLEGRALLEQKAEELLRHPPWQMEALAGFLEAFDVAVFAGGTRLLPALSDLIRRQDNLAVAHASFLALDRLVINDPAGTLKALQAAPELMDGREQTRANYFARADVRDSGQRRILESYLADPKLSVAELEAFAGVYPNANFMVSHNLLTRTPTPDRLALAARDTESLRVVKEWLGDPRLAKVRPAIEKMRLRLEEFARPAKAQN